MGLAELDEDDGWKVFGARRAGCEAGVAVFAAIRRSVSGRYQVGVWGNAGRRRCDLRPTAASFLGWQPVGVVAELLAEAVFTQRLCSGI